MPGKLSEATALFLDDYLLVGATIGLPALFCLFFYVYVTFLELRRAESYVHLVDTFFDWPVTVCRACSLVLIVGFLPERGLFDASTGILFWVLLEAGTLRHQICDSQASP